jgi:FixJ family two-component response regulator
MPGARPSVVVVEDDASMRQAIERILRAGGFAVVMFQTAEAALEGDTTTTADCLVLDIHLTGMSGFDLYRRLKQIGWEPPAIFITAHDEPEVREEAEKIGARSYLPKPFSGRTLLNAVARALSSQRPL